MTLLAYHLHFMEYIFKSIIVMYTLIISLLSHILREVSPQCELNLNSTSVSMYKSFSQRGKAVSLNVNLLDLNNEFLNGTHLPNRIEKTALPEHIRHCFSIDGNSIQIGGLHADSPDELVCVCVQPRGLSLYINSGLPATIPW